MAWCLRKLTGEQMHNSEKKNKLILECINRQYVKALFDIYDEKGKCYLFPRSEPLWYLVIANPWEKRRQPQL